VEDSQRALWNRQHIIQRDWARIVELEAAALKNSTALEIKKDCFWLAFPVNRIAFAQNELEIRHHTMDSIDGFQRTAAGVCNFIPDSAGPEDVHQHERDECRRRRFEHLCNTRIHQTQVVADVIGMRGMNGVHIPDETVVRAMSSHRTAKSSEHTYVANPKLLPAPLRGIMNSTGWSSPNGNTYTRAASAFCWLTAWNSDFRAAAVPLKTGRHSRLASEYSMVFSGRMVRFVISTLPWHLWVCEAARIDTGLWKLRTNETSCHEFFLTDPLETRICRCKATYVAGVGVAIDTRGDPGLAAWKSALRDGLPLSLEHIRDLQDLLGVPVADRGNNTEQAREAMILIAFDNELDREEARRAFSARLAKADDEPEYDESFAELLEELLIHDASNDSDVKDLRRKAKAALKNKWVADATRTRRKSQRRKGRRGNERCACGFA
jgi:hypothetical protein